MFLVDDILKAAAGRDTYYPVDLVLLDLFKVFDTVAHNKLLLNLAILAFSVTFISELLPG